MASVGLGEILRAREATFAGDRKDTTCILIWLDGGPSHMDLYDMKPQAPRQYRGIWSPIRTNVPGIHITELFPQQAKVADKFSIIGSLHHDNGDHFSAAHLILTTCGGTSGSDQEGKSPSIGAYTNALLGPRRPGLPAYASIPHAATVGRRAGYFGGNYLGAKYNPFDTGGNPGAKDFKVTNLNLPGGMSIDRLADRKALQRKFEKLHRDVDGSGIMAAVDRFDQQAFEMVAGDAARAAFDITAEPKELRDRYGRTAPGQSLLLARRLAEAGVTFTTVNLSGWDHHWNLEAGMHGRLPRLDQALAALFQDLSDRSLMQNVLVVVCGEFSRTPRMNDGGAPMSMGTPGRDHWGNAMFAILSGGGLNMGQVVGATDRLGETPVHRLLRPGDLHATIYHVLGIDPTVSFLDHTGRPVPVLHDGKAIAELI